MANGDEAAWMNKLAKAIDEHDYPTIVQMVPNESMRVLSAPEQAQTPAKANEPANNPVRSTVQGNSPVRQVAEAQKAAPKKQVDVTPLPTQETQQNEGVRIAQPQQTIDEQNAQMDARIAAIEQQPLAQRKALGQQYLDTLRQNNVPFSEKKLAKPLMNGEPGALEHAQRTYGDLLNTITPAEAAVTSQLTAQANTSAEQAIQAIRNLPKEKRLEVGRKYSKFLRNNNIFLVDANENYKLHTLLNYGHPEAIYQVQQQYGDQIAQKEGGLSTIPDDAIAAAKQADDGFSAPLNIFSSDEQATLRNAGLVYKDNNYNGAERVKVDLLFEEGDRRMKAARKAKAEAKASAADINQVKTQEGTKGHESTQSKNQQKPDEGTKNQDQHVEPEPRKAAEPQPEAEAREVSATKKAADEGGQESKDETKLSAAEEQTFSGTSDEAKQVYTIVRDQLTTSKSKGAQCAASVGAAILARHADVYAKAYSKATGKKYTAMDYLNEKFGLNMTGQPIEGRAFNQAMSKSKATSLAEFAQIATSGEVDPNGKKKTFYSVNATNDIRVDFPIDDTRHSVNKHNLTGQQLQAIEDNLENIVSAYQDTKKKGHYGGLPVLAHIVTPIGDAGITFEFSPYGRVFVTTMFFDTKQNIENWAQKNGASRSLADDKSASSFTGHPLSISTIQQKLGIGNEKVYNQTAWHGSPHDFDRFDLGAIGTGEGAQVHGWGLYFAANREVSEGYIERLSDVIGHEIAKDGSIVQKSDEEWATIDNAPIDENTPPLVIALKLLREVRAKGNYNIGDAIQKLQWQYIQRMKDDIVASDFLTKWYKKFKYRNTLKNLKAAEQILKEGKYDFKNITSGHLFEVEIPDADTMLDKQLSYSEQPKMVQKAIDALYAERKKLAKEWKGLSAENFKEIYHLSGEAWTYFMDWNRLKSLT